MTTAQFVETSVIVNNRTTFTQTIILNLIMKWLLGSNLSQFYSILWHIFFTSGTVLTRETQDTSRNSQIET